MLHSVFVLGCHVGAEKWICLVSLCCCAPQFESVTEKARVVDIVIAEAKKLGVGNGFIAIGGKLLTIVKLEEKVFNWGGRIPLRCHSGVVGSEVLGGDCPVFLPEVLEDLKGSATTELGDRVFERCEIFVRAVVGDHGNKNNLEFAEGFVVLACDAVLAYIFRDLESSETVCVRRIWSWVERRSKGGVVVPDRDVDCIGDDKTEET